MVVRKDLKEITINIQINSTTIETVRRFCCLRNVVTGGNKEKNGSKKTSNHDKQAKISFSQQAHEYRNQKSTKSFV